MESKHRERICGAYNSGRQEPPFPNTLEGLKTRLPYLRKLVRKQLPENLDLEILDLGCGYGALIHVAKQEGYRNVSGIDASPEQVAAAKELGIDGVEQGDVMDALGVLEGLPKHQ